MNVPCFPVDNIIKKYKIPSEEKEIIYSFDKEANKYLNWFCEFTAKVKNKEKPQSYFQKMLNEKQNDIVSWADFLENKVRSRPVKLKLRELFREAVKKYICQSKILKRAYEKPRGYPGDYFVFEMAYDNKPISIGIGYYLDNWILQHPLTKGIQYRKDRMKRFLGELITEANGNRGEEFKIVNMGCGGGREIRELLKEEKGLDKSVSFFCFDQDEEPLSFAQKWLREITHNCKINFFKKDVLTMLGLKKGDTQVNSADIIYSMGIVDYFMKTTLEYFIKGCYKLLKPKGKLIIPFCSSYNPQLYTHLRWLCEWEFYAYDADFMEKFIINEVGIKKVKIIWEDKQPIFFTVIEK